MFRTIGPNDTHPMSSSIVRPIAPPLLQHPTNAPIHVTQAVKQEGEHDDDGHIVLVGVQAVANYPPVTTAITTTPNTARRV